VAKWLFPQEKATFAHRQKWHGYSDFALAGDLRVVPILEKAGQFGLFLLAAALWIYLQYRQEKRRSERKMQKSGIRSLSLKGK
jgi:hypothetical protein